MVNRIPLDEEELKECYKDAKKEALAHFHKRAVGNVAEEFVRDLKNKMQTVYETLRDENERESIHATQMCL